MFKGMYTEGENQDTHYTVRSNQRAIWLGNSAEYTFQLLITII